MQNKRGLTTWYLVQKITKAYFLIFEEQKNNKVIHMLIYDKKKNAHSWLQIEIRHDQINIVSISKY